MTFDEAEAYLASLAPRGWRMGLDRMQAFAEAAGLGRHLGPIPRFIHIAGTNGKGSTTAYAQSLLIESGRRTGAFFSPYVYDMRERVQCGRHLISQDDFARIVTELRPVAESFTETEFGGVTEFELKTAVGFQYWHEQECDAVALEVGLGGRLDSTNIVDPAVCIIVSIGLDHMAILGDRVEAIAFEKAGIIKPGKPVMMGKMPYAAEQVILDIARDRGAPAWRLGHEIEVKDHTVITPLRTVTHLTPGLTGVHQPGNMALAVAAVIAADLAGTDDQIREGVARASAPGRFERRLIGDQLFILDGAHNPDAARSLRATLDELYPEETFTLITGMVGGHEPEPFFEPLRDRVGQVFVAPINFHRAISPAEIAAHLEYRDVEVCPSVESAIQQAIQLGAPVLVSGSFYLVGDVGRALDARA